MNVKGDQIQVFSGGVDEKGERLEPEQQLVARVVDIDAPAHMQVSGQQVGTVKSQIIIESTAGEAALTLRGMCGDCKYFDQKRWWKDLSKADAPLAPIEARQAVNSIRALLLESQDGAIVDAASGPDGDFDVELAMRQSGYCHALFAFFKNLGESVQDASTIVHATSSCPKFVRTATEPQGFFEPRDNEAIKLGAAKYDQVMRLADSIKK